MTYFEAPKYVANYLANRFDPLNGLASSYHSATNDIEGPNVPLDLADLQAELRIDEFDRTRANLDHCETSPWRCHPLPLVRHVACYAERSVKLSLWFLVPGRSHRPLRP